MPRTQKALLLASVAVVLLVSVFHFGHGAWAAGASGFVDFPIFLANTAGFLETGVLYPFADDLESYAPATAVYKFPPLYTVFLIPLVRSGIGERAYVLHWAVQLALYAAAVGWLVHLLCGARRIAFVLTSLVVALNFEPFFETLWRLQIETPLLFLFAVIFYGLTRKRDEAAGMALGFAAFLKVYPGFLLLYFLQRRRWLTVAWSAAMAVLALLACLIIFGVEQNAVYFFEILPWMAREAPSASVENLGIGRYLQTLFGATPELAKTIGRLIGLPLVGLSLYAVHRHAGQRRSSLGPALEFALFLPLMLLLMPNSWVHYQLLLLPAILVLLGVGFDAPRLHGGLVGAALAATALLTFYAPCAEPSVPWPCAQTPSWLGLVRLPRPLHDFLVETRILGTAIVWGATIWALLRPADRAADEPTPAASTAGGS